MSHTAIVARSLNVPSIVALHQARQLVREEDILVVDGGSTDRTIEIASRYPSRVIVAKELQLGQLVQIPLRPRLIRSFSAVYPKERFHSRLVAAFLAFAKEQLASAQPLAA